ncbi:ABC transporter substrate-binding protein [Desulfonema magnum]|uniref:Vitamin B12 ABC transporter, substrate-binding protein n=1 Tax=Desulfonema magnum TaxID=45655 RepID=A0A975GMI7_9BACT|nr:cobalamin-binding protein [Desulfonema magnum]QTA85888.1 Vitamin B12 ABC transporter, substrate-binding protein [Desulfonema magnum]
MITYRLFVIFFIIPAFFFCTAEAQSASRKVTDQAGREITLSDDPQRIVSLAPSVTEIIFAIGRQDRLKGVTRFSDFPPEAKKLPRVGSYTQLQLEKILALKPDICIGVRDGNPQIIIHNLEVLNVPVYLVDPGNLDEVMKTILELGTLLNADDAAKAVVDDMETRITRIKSLVAKAPYRPRVFFQIGIIPIVAVGTGTFIHELITSAGGKNLSEGPTLYPRLNREQVLALSPEVFIITSMARGGIFEEVKAEWSRWTTMPAIRDKRIFIVDSNLFDRPTPRLADGLELLFRRIHPELIDEYEAIGKGIKKKTVNCQKKPFGG